MADLGVYVEAELENIRQVLDRLPVSGKLAGLSDLELAGTAALLHSIYGGIENILKQTFSGRGIKLPEGASWHRDLLCLAEKHGVVQPTTSAALRPFMAFRHFFSHAYALELDPARMEALVRDAERVVEIVKTDVFAYLQSQAVK